MKTIQLVLAIHDHQPVGNFDHVIDAACAEAYEPFLDCMARYPDIPFALHVSGSLLEWIEQHRPALVEKLAKMVRAGGVEILGGGFYEPIMTMLPERDRVGQLTTFSHHLRNRLSATVRGAWLAERVWEANLASSLADAGVEFTVVDDFHFKCAGLRDEDLLGSYVTEDQGRILRIFPGSEKLRYLIPFADPEETVEYLGSLASEAGDRVIVYADDGEKFGVWPGTHKHVYEDGWLVRFLEALRKNAEWLRVRSFSDVLASTQALGKVYLPDASYREMTEWALPARTMMEYEDVEKDLDSANLRERVRPFVRGGTWRAFKTKYVEAAQLYARMIQVSAQVARSRAAVSRRQQARTELYRGQCNCGYWHGVFGGLYLPFLRFETYRHLLKAERLVAGARTRPFVEVDDFDLDGRNEVCISTAGTKLYIKPDRGGHAYEWDDTGKCINLMANFTRRQEAYHRKLIEREHTPSDTEGVISIHDTVRVKEPGLDKRLIYDRYVRESLIDHFFEKSATCNSASDGTAAELLDVTEAPYALRRLKRGGVCLSCAKGTARIEKRITPKGALGFEIRVSVEAPDMPEAIYGIEFNIALLAGDAPDRYYVGSDGANLGCLRTVLDLEEATSLALVDEWLGVKFCLRFQKPARVWAFPIETVSESEGGFERVYQSSAVIVNWPFSDRGEFTVHAEVKHR